MKVGRYCLRVTVTLLSFYGTIVAGEIVPGPVHNWDAALDTDGNATWEDNGSQADRDWGLVGAAGPNANGPARIAVQSETRLTHAYSFDGVDDAASTDPENRSGNHDTTFEIWFQPNGFPIGDARTVFEHGNGPRGITIGLDADRLVFAFNPGSAAPMSFDLDSDDDGIDNAGFIQVVGVVDDTDDALRLYIDGGNEQTVALDESSDFTSNDSLGLGRNSGRGGGGQAGSALTWGGYFAGDIAIVREYRSAFTLSEVQQNYQAVAVPEPTAALLLIVGCLGLVTGRRRNMAF